MRIGEYCNVGCVCCKPETPIALVAGLMREHEVGAVVVVEDNELGRIPLGIITDRDIVIEALAVDLDTKVITAGDIMNGTLQTVKENDDIFSALKLMREHRVRRLPVLNHSGTLYGIISMDDIVNMLSMELSLVTAAIVEQTTPHKHEAPNSV